MSGAMFLKECRKTLNNITYLVFVAVLILFCYSQFWAGLEKIEKPQQGQESYGTKYAEVPEIIMPNATENLFREFTSNSYIAYPVGFYKNIKLNDKKQGEMAGILSQLTGISKDELMKSVGMESVTVDGTLTYEKFLKLMEQADKLIGGGSMYDGIYLVRFGKVPMTYEDALSEYDDIVEKDRITGAYARLFCDYLGIILAIFPVFIAVAASMKDRRARMQELIYAKEMSSFKIVFTRYFSMILIMFLPVLLMAVYTQIQVAGDYSGFYTDKLAFIKYSFGWLLPTLMVSTAVGTFFTELTDTAIAIAVQGLWWFIGMFGGMKHIDGGYGAALALRHNKIGNTQVYLEHLNILLLNRIGYMFFALVLIVAAVWIYELKRRGKFNAFDSFKKIFTHRLSKFKA